MFKALATPKMLKRRYSLLLSDRNTGVLRRFTIHLNRVLAGLIPLILIPVLSIFYFAFSSHTTIDSLVLNNTNLKLENSEYQLAVTDVAQEMAKLRTAMSDLAYRAEIDPQLKEALHELPGQESITSGLSNGLSFEETGAVLSRLENLLGSLNKRLDFVKKDIAIREALADATPLTWPTDGWLSAGYGYRADPFTGERDFHPAVDISTKKGEPVYSTASGKVLSASRNGDYGNLVEIDHGFGVKTRYGHLSEFLVGPGDTVIRGDIIGSVGNTGRATGYHVHYEVWVDDRTVNPRRLVIDSKTFDAN